MGVAGHLLFEERLHVHIYIHNVMVVGLKGVHTDQRCQLQEQKEISSTIKQSLREREREREREHA